MASAPLPAHESILSVVMVRLGSVLESIPISDQVYFDVRGAALVRKDSIIGVPDGLIKIWSERNAVRSGPSEGRGQRQPNNQHPSDCDNARRGPPKLR